MNFMKKRFTPFTSTWMIVWALLLTLIFGCTADFDEFGTSPYKELKLIAFEEQQEDAVVYNSEHRMEIKLQAPPKNQETWDSVTVTSFSLSNMASIHVVNSKIKEFFTDSLKADSLSQAVSYDKNKVTQDSKIALPKNGIVYLVAVAENGDRTLWQLKFTTPQKNSDKKEDEQTKSSDNDLSLTFDKAVDSKISGDSLIITFPQGFNIKNATLKSVSTHEKAKISPDPKSIKSWSKPQKIKVTAEDGSEKVWTVYLTTIKNNATDLQLKFDNQLKVRRSQDTIYIDLKNGSSLKKAALTSWSTSEGATVSPKPDGVKSWKNFQSFKVTAEDGTIKTWVLALSIAAADEVASSEKELLSIFATGEESAASIDKSKKTVELHLTAGSNIEAVEVTLKISETASHNLPETVDLRTPVTFTITAEDASTETWTLTATVPEVIEPPSVQSLKIEGMEAIIDNENKSIHLDTLPFLTDLSSLKLTELKLSKKASASGLEEGKTYDFENGQELVVKNPAGESIVYKVKAGYQLPGSDFNIWDEDNNIKPDSIWGNANMANIGLYMTTKKSEGSMIAAEIETKDLFIKKASGSLYTAVFDPNDVGIMGMMKTEDWPDGNELLDFGKKFNARPEYVEFKFAYSGKGDSCDLYVLLENRTGDKNTNRKSDDVNKLVASAWYRSTTDDNGGRPNPDLVSISEEKNEDGMRTVRLKFKYGEPLEDSPIWNSSTFDTTVKSANEKAINNGLIQGTGDEPVTHIRVVFASSADGNHYQGTNEATLVIDEMRLIY